VVGEAIEECGGHFGIAEDGGPFAEAQVSRDDDAGALVEFAVYLFISHDMTVIERMSHHMAVLRHGKMVEYGPRRQIMSAARDPYTRALIASVPRPDPFHRQPAPELLAELPF